MLFPLYQLLMIFAVACERRRVELLEWHAASYPELFEPPPPADPIACSLALTL